MKNILLAACSVVAFSQADAASAATAHGECGDILKDGVMSATKYYHNSYLQQIIWSRFLESTYEESKRDRAAGMDVTYGQFVFGGDYNSSDFEQRKRQIERENFDSYTASQITDLALMSGDRGILDAWSGCMSKRSGIALRFSEQTSKIVVLNVEYFSTEARNFDRLKYNIDLTPSIPSNRISDPFRCLRRDTKIYVNKPCQVTITMDSAFDVLVANAQADHSSDSAFLPRRIKLLPENDWHAFAHADRLIRNDHKAIYNVEGSISMPADKINEGWYYLPHTASIIMKISDVNRGGTCDYPWASATPYSMKYGYRLWAPKRNRARSAAVTCEAVPALQMIRKVWVDRDADMKNPKSNERLPLSPLTNNNSDQLNRRLSAGPSTGQPLPG